MMKYRNAKYNSDGSIDCEIEHPQYGWIPFTCDPNDKGSQFDTAALFEEMKPNSAPYAPPPFPSQEDLDAISAAEARAERDRLLTASDWTQVADAAVDQAAWAAYRQALRDIPQQAGFPGIVTWPAEPE